ncbi:MAG: phosphatidate cytidylyltransferase [Alphaproteobacteria bacterium]
MAIIGLFAVLALYEWFSICFSSEKSPLCKISWLVIGSTYIAAGCYAFWLIDVYAYHALLSISLLISIFAYDIGAYFVGSTLGGPKLCPAISPAKTWSGFIGGTTLCTMTVYFLLEIYDPSYSPAGTIASGLIVSVLAQAGDLLESWTKRSFNIKDSGHLIPGHGGVLDRIDSCLMVSIAVALYIYVLGL